MGVDVDMSGSANATLGLVTKIDTSECGKQNEKECRNLFYFETKKLLLEGVSDDW